ncbi:hypothetical protein HGRIS_014006 [Hohenbuehelia grisea]|uniref:Uncharacterized protein n=1 Tax=Hohenbuehelia grisea TaxID=104357 RepID=A0ABR3JSQ2_9AGAR
MPPKKPGNGSKAKNAAKARSVSEKADSVIKTAPKQTATPRTIAPKPDNIIEHRPVTRVKNQSQHPGDNHTKYDTVCLTPAEVEADRQAKAAAQLATKTKKIAEHRAQIQKAR